MKWVVPFIRKKGRPRGVVHNIFWQIMLSKWRLYCQKKYKYYIAGKIIRLDQDKCKDNKNKLLLIITYNSTTYTKWKSFIHWQVEELVIVKMGSWVLRGIVFEFFHVCWILPILLQRYFGLKEIHTTYLEILVPLFASMKLLLPHSK